MKKNQKWDPFKNQKLTKYEREIEASLERGEWISVPMSEEEKKMWQDAARRNIEERKSESVTFRVSPSDLKAFKNKAKEKKLPYQTLLGLLITEYLAGKFPISI